MKILVLGNKWHGNWSKTIHEEILLLGHASVHIDVHFVRKLPIHKLDNIRKKIFFRRVQRQVEKEISRQVIDRIVVITPYGIPDTIWRLLKDTKVPMIGWWGDDPLTKADTKEVLPIFDKIFLVDTSWVKKIQKYNPNTYYMPHAASEKNFYPIPQKTKRHEVTFVGSSFDGKKDGVKRAETLAHLYNKNISLSLFGDKGWKKMSSKYPFLKNIYNGPIKTTAMLNKVYNESTIILNIHHGQLESGTNQRSFEAAASGTFQIADYRESVEELFSGEIATYTSLDELAEKVLFFLKDEDKRSLLSNKARKIALDKHTYKKRLPRLLEE